MNATPKTTMTLTDISTTPATGNTVSAGGSCGCCAPQQATPSQPSREAAVSADYSVSGLTCGSCAGRVSSAIGALNGVDDVQIALVPGGTSTVSVTSTQPISQASVRDAVKKAGYQLTTA